MGYPTKGIACALNILRYEHYPYDNLDQNNLTHGVYWIPQARLVFLIGFGKVM